MMSEVQSTAEALAGERKRGERGKRRQGREMALQMLFQWEASGLHPSEVLRSFDIYLYQAETAKGAKSSGGLEPTEPGADGLLPSKLEAEDDDPIEMDSIDQRREAAKQENIDRQVSIDIGAKGQSKPYQFARSLVLGVVEHQETIDQTISAGADNWRIERMPQVDRNILRLALFEAQHLGELPKAVIIDEGIELAKKFGGENSGAFVNGLLDGLLAGIGTGGSTDTVASGASMAGAKE